MIYDRLKNIISQLFSVDEKTINMDTDFEDDLGADSVDVMELLMALEEEFEGFMMEDMSEDDIATVHTVGELLKYLQDRLEDN